MTPTVWRAKIYSEREDLLDDSLRDAARDYCRRAGVVGVGWGRPEITAPGGAPLQQVLAEIYAKGKDWKSGGDTVRRLAEDASQDDFVWTRDSAGGYWLGRISGPWRFDASTEATRWDLNNVRDCTWLDGSFRDYEIPGAVVRSFTGRTSSSSRVAPSSLGGWKMTELIWQQAIDPRAPRPELDPEQIISDLIDPIDVEDLALMFLQAQGWLLLPSSRMGDTPLYEAALRHKDDGRLAVLAVKSGSSNPVPVQLVAESVRKDKAEVFVFSTHGLYDVAPEDVAATEITTQQLTAFMAARPELLAPRISRWVEPRP
jgi:hypothetical protein